MHFLSRWDKDLFLKLKTDLHPQISKMLMSESLLSARVKKMQ